MMSVEVFSDINFQEFGRWNMSGFLAARIRAIVREVHHFMLFKVSKPAPAEAYTNRKWRSPLPARVMDDREVEALHTRTKASHDTTRSLRDTIDVVWYREPIPGRQVEFDVSIGPQGTQVPYQWIHEFGGPAGRGAKIPKRPYIAPAAVRLSKLIQEELTGTVLAGPIRDWILPNMQEVPTVSRWTGGVAAFTGRASGGGGGVANVSRGGGTIKTGDFRYKG